MLPETLHQLILVCAEVIWVSFVVAGSDVSIVVVQSLLFDVLILSSEHFMPLIKVLGCLLKSHGLYIPANLEIEVTHADCTLSEHHVNGLSNCAIALIFKLRINRKGNLSLSKFNLVDDMLLVIEFDNVAGTILEPESQARFALIVDGEVLFCNYVSHVTHRLVAHTTAIALAAHSVRE